MIKTYTKDLTAARPEASTAETTGSPVWFHQSDTFEWVSGKGVGETYGDDLSLLDPQYTGALKYFEANILIESSGDIDDYAMDYSLYISAANASFFILFGRSHIYPHLDIDVSIQAQNLDTTYPRERVYSVSGIVNLKIVDDSSNYLVKINDSTILSVLKNESDVSIHIIGGRSLDWSGQNDDGDTKKLYLQNIHIEYDEFVDSPFWTDLVNCHEVTT